MCDCCDVAREYPDLPRRQYDVKCIYCGARYWLSIPEFRSEPEKIERWRAHVLEVWGDWGHDLKHLTDLTRGGVTPLAPAKPKGKR